MPPNALQGKRIRIMNELFRSPRGYTKDELVQIVGERIRDYRKLTDKIKDGPGITASSIDKDIRYMREHYRDEIPCVDGKYRYKDPNHSIEGVLLDSDEIAMVKVATALIRNIPGFELYKDLKDVIRKLEMQADIDSDEQQAIQFDTRLGYSGNKHLTRLFQAITSKRVIRFHYKDFHESEGKEVTVHPYLLKEYNNRWSLIGVTEESRQAGEYVVSRYGLERIIEPIKPAPDVEYYQDYKFNPETYLKDIIGVSINPMDEVQEVILKFSEKREPYVRTNPLHHTQDLVKGTTTTYSFNVIPNKELEALILFFGPDVEVLKPVSLRNRIAALINEAGKKYL